MSFLLLIMPSEQNSRKNTIVWPFICEKSGRCFYYRFWLQKQGICAKFSGRFVSLLLLLFSLTTPHGAEVNICLLLIKMSKLISYFKLFRHSLRNLKGHGFLGNHVQYHKYLWSWIRLHRNKKLN